MRSHRYSYWRPAFASAWCGAREMARCVSIPLNTYRPRSATSFPISLSMLFSKRTTSASSTRRVTFANRRSCRTLSKELKDYPSPRLLRFGEDFAPTPSFGRTRSRSHGGITTARRSALARRASGRQPHPRSGTKDELEAQRNRLHSRLGR
jgi:hypothetical protein